MLDAIDHAGIAVEDLEAAVTFYRDVLKLPLVHRETLPDQGVDTALFDIGDSHIELLTPLGPQTSVARFLERRGPGLHHVAYRVDDIELTLESSCSRQACLIDSTPRIGLRGSRVAFVHPSSTGGVRLRSSSLRL